MTTKLIRQKLAGYIEQADPQKLKALYTLLQAEVEDMDMQDEIEEEMDEAFWNELDRRSAEMEKGVNVITREESKERGLTQLVSAKK